MRVKQPVGSKGSLKWLQQAIETNPACLQPAGLANITWLSPLKSDNHAEYRDGAFLELLGLGHLKPELAGFWPPRGPQWDALGRIGTAPVLVEAKAHIGEFLSPSTSASAASRQQIERAMAATQRALGAKTTTDWCAIFYQYANRIAHLNWLHQNNIPANLIFVSFLNDSEMSGPTTAESWKTAFKIADYALGIPTRHPLKRYIHHVTPDVSQFAHG